MGGGADDRAQSVSTSSDGSIYITGYTNGSIDGQSNNGSNDVFIAKFNSDGSKEWTKLLGGVSYDSAQSVSISSDGSIYIAGSTQANIDVQAYFGHYDAFIAKFNSEGSKEWIKLFGGDFADHAQSVSAASDGSIYIVGTNHNLGFDNQSNNGNADAFITKFNSDGSKEWTKLLGGGENDFAQSVSTSSDGSIYITGDTLGSIDGQSNNGSYDAFIAKFNSDGSKAWTKLLGGTSWEHAQSVSTSSDGSIYITGYTYGSIDGQSNNGNADAFITKFNSDGSKEWTKLLGGGESDFASSISTASDGSIYIAGGYTDGNLDGQRIYGGTYSPHAFITKLNRDS